MSQGPETQVRHVMPIIDRHDHIIPEDRHHIAPARVFLGLLVLGEGPQGHDILHHAAVLEHVIDGVCVVRACLLKKSLEVVYQRLCLELATARGGSDTLHVGAARFLVIIIVPRVP
jgi:hypothetical protein